MMYGAEGAELVVHKEPRTSTADLRTCGLECDSCRISSGSRSAESCEDEASKGGKDDNVKSNGVGTAAGVDRSCIGCENRPGSSRQSRLTFLIRLLVNRMTSVPSAKL